jgi:hypothetical protein
MNQIGMNMNMNGNIPNNMMVNSGVGNNMMEMMKSQFNDYGYVYTFEDLKWDKNPIKI